MDLFGPFLQDKVNYEQVVVEPRTWSTKARDVLSSL
jgi:hypothetical protein